MRYSHSLHKSRAKHSLFNWQTIFYAIIVFSIIAVAFGLSSYAKIDTNTFIVGLIASFLRVSAAYLIAVVLSLIFALLITLNSQIEAIFLPLFDVLQSFPSFALFPLLVHVLAAKPNSVIILVLTITMIWPMLFAIITGIKGRRTDLEEAATIFGAKGWRRLTKFTLPMLFPSIVSGSIVGWGEGWEFIIGAELLVNIQTGVGRYLGDLGKVGQENTLFYGIILLLIFLFIINKIIWLPLLHQSTNYQTES